jgi:hypothetical protein
VGKLILSGELMSRSTPLLVLLHGREASLPRVEVPKTGGPGMLERDRRHSKSTSSIAETGVRLIGTNSTANYSVPSIRCTKLRSFSIDCSSEEHFRPQIIQNILSKCPFKHFLLFGSLDKRFILPRTLISFKHGIRSNILDPFNSSALERLR